MSTHFVNYNDRDNLARSKDEALALAQVYMRHGSKDLDARVFQLNGSGGATMISQLRWDDNGTLTIWNR